MALKQSPLQVYELLENVFSYLPYSDLNRVRQVNHFWNSLITTSPPIQRHLWKLPETLQTPNNTWDDINSILCPNGQAKFLQKHNALKRVLKEGPVSYDAWNRYEDQERDFRRRIEDYNNAGNDDRKALLHCNKCCNLHPTSCYLTIHPLLQDLERLVCITGEGSALLANIGVFSELNCSFLTTRLLNLALYLVNLLKRWHTCKNDMFTRPVCTRLIVTSGRDCYDIQNKASITVRRAVMAISWECCNSLKGLRGSDFDMLIEDVQLLDIREWLEINDERIAEMFLEEMQRLNGKEVEDADGKKKALESLRDYLVDELSKIAASDILEDVKIV